MISPRTSGADDRYTDREAVSRQLGREPSPFQVATRCPFGLPSVIENEQSQNMPTRFWITCPALAAGISRIESAGGVREAQEELGSETIAEIHEEHRARYGVRVAGVREGGHVKCLHAFTALQLSGALPNPVAGWTLERIGESYPRESCCTQPPGDET